MKFAAVDLVTKISVSNMSKSKGFYEKTLGFQLDARYTINSDNDFGEMSYMQFNLEKSEGQNIIFGLYKDIDKPFDPMPNTGTVPSFIVDDIEATLSFFQKNEVVIDKIGGDYILTNKSDQGYIDKFFFFRDPDNNSLVIRQNINQ
ncbi:VOC family protein [Algoriphagus aquimarinus]|uniref:VOC domain-containing protein n=1 Tax=Algoriphagus aquimarinus TaxID=237018 RepID=A0A5C7AJR4_9BACT|nr:VOC family protein [Algoriphagus aquimarinus]TXE08848.1 hypothetical protein ESV85_13575 [Algoriphagus aquimarinus]|tara:strand:- start:494 stop:931 length:438 start_codon:yes stop_codon:yes gene_type:complete